MEEDKPILNKVAEELRAIEKQVKNLEGFMGEFEKRMKGIESQLQKQIGDPE